MKRWMLPIVIFLGGIKSVCVNADIVQLTNPNHTTTAIKHSRVTDNDIDKVLAITARRWGLSVVEYSRYNDIVQGPLGHWNPHIDPVLALGIYAENELDQQRYAELYAQQEYELTQRTQVFERAYHVAFNRLYPDAKMIDRQLLQPYYDRDQQTPDKKSSTASFFSPHFQTGDRILYFPRVDCLDCGQQVQYWHTLLQSLTDTGIDIYVVAAESADQVRQWAKVNAIEPAWVKNGSVTLNVDSGFSEKLAEQVSGPSSAWYLSRDQTIFTLNPKRLGL